MVISLGGMLPSRRLHRHGMIALCILFSNPPVFYPGAMMGVVRSSPVISETTGFRDSESRRSVVTWLIHIPICDLCPELCAESIAYTYAFDISRIDLPVIPKK